MNQCPPSNTTAQQQRSLWFRICVSHARLHTRMHALTQTHTYTHTQTTPCTPSWSRNTSVRQLSSHFAAFSHIPFVACLCACVAELQLCFLLFVGRPHVRLRAVAAAQGRARPGRHCARRRHQRVGYPYLFPAQCLGYSSPFVLSAVRSCCLLSVTSRPGVLRLGGGGAVCADPHTGPAAHRFQRAPR